ncbi:MAG: hypothetical protein KDF63_11165, partial [Rhodoferax sp.]|nr:hypothetical protein [Rhodoferax sp.]
MDEVLAVACDAMVVTLPTNAGTQRHRPDAARQTLPCAGRRPARRRCGPGAQTGSPDAVAGPVAHRQER